MNIVVVTRPDDLHAAAVTFGLKRIGKSVAQFHPSDFPQRSLSSMHFSNAEGIRAEVLGVRDRVNIHEVDVVWLRRLNKSVISSGLHVADRETAERECARFVDGLLNLVPNNTFWVNSPEAASRAGNKVVQLRAAVDAGVRVPATLITNSPGDVRAFYEVNGGSIIFKPFRFVTWAHGEGSSSLFTAIVTEEHLSQIEQIALCPGIFQENVKKNSEIRVNVMGREIHAIRIYSQDNERTSTDSRVLQNQSKPRTSVHPCDDRLKTICYAMMDSLCLSFGCFDFIISDLGEYVFLEVNEMGQFLWLEDWEPELPVLDTFVKFLASRDRLFTRSSSSVDVTMESFYQSHDFMAHRKLEGEIREGSAHVRIQDEGVYVES